MKRKELEKHEAAELTRLEKVIVLHLIEATHKIAKINYLVSEPLLLKNYHTGGVITDNGLVHGELPIILKEGSK